MHESEQAPGEPDPRTGRRRRLIKWAAFLVYLVVLLEVGARVYYVIGRQMPLFAIRC